MNDSGDQTGLHESWQPWLLPELEKAPMQALLRSISDERRHGKLIYPPQDQLLAAFNGTPFEKVRVVILGQDPYHGPGQAHGLCFSVQRGCLLPPSLRNIFKELRSDLALAEGTELTLAAPLPADGCLVPWAEQGVLLLNAVLSVEAGRPGSHQGRGWEEFTDHVITLLNREKQHLVFLLWGAHAQRKGRFIDRERHLVLESAHPSPLSASRGFFGCRHFSRANAYLRAHGQAPVDWLAQPNTSGADTAK